jgi:hypothetical protein
LQGDGLPQFWEGGSEKLWRDQDGSRHSELFIFGEYDTEAAFQADVEKILREAREVCVKRNIDEFLAVTDIVERRESRSAMRMKMLKIWRACSRKAPKTLVRGAILGMALACITMWNVRMNIGISMSQPSPGRGSPAHP